MNGTPFRPGDPVHHIHNPSFRMRVAYIDKGRIRCRWIKGQFTKEAYYLPSELELHEDSPTDHNAKEPPVKPCQCVVPHVTEDKRERLYMCMVCGGKVASRLDIEYLGSMEEVAKWDVRRAYSVGSVRASIQF